MFSGPASVAVVAAALGLILLSGADAIVTLTDLRACGADACMLPASGKLHGVSITECVVVAVDVVLVLVFVALLFKGAAWPGNLSATSFGVLVAGASGLAVAAGVAGLVADCGDHTTLHVATMVAAVAYAAPTLWWVSRKK